MSNAARIFRPYSTPADGYICTFRFSPYFSRSFSYFVLYLLVKSSAVMLVKICITFLVAWLRFISLISFSFNFFFSTKFKRTTRHLRKAVECWCSRTLTLKLSCDLFVSWSLACHAILRLGTLFLLAHFSVGSFSLTERNNQNSLYFP